MPRMWKAVYVNNDDDGEKFDSWAESTGLKMIPSLDTDIGWELVDTENDVLDDDDKEKL